MTGHILTGKKMICNFLGRSWTTVESWIRELDFPARRIDGVWESDAELINAWRRSQITNSAAPIIETKKPVKRKRC